MKSAVTPRVRKGLKFVMEKALPLDVARKVYRDAYMADGNRLNRGGCFEGYIRSPLLRLRLTPLLPVLKSRFDACRGRLARSSEGEFRRLRPWQFYNAPALLQRPAVRQRPGQVVKCAQGAHVGRATRVFQFKRAGIFPVDKALAAFGQPDSMRLYSLTAKA